MKILSSLLIPSIGLVVACVFGCNSKSPPAEPVSVEAELGPSQGTGLEILGTVPPFQLTDQDGNAFDSTTLSGKLWIANFFFTSCTATCPQQSKEMAKFQSIEQLDLLSISVQPEVDTPEALTRYAEQYAANHAQWHFLTGSRAAIWELSKQGFMLPVGDAPAGNEMPIFHSSKFILVDGRQQIRGFYESQSLEEMAQLRADIASLAAGDLTQRGPSRQDALPSPDSSPKAEHRPSAGQTVSADDASQKLDQLQDDVQGAFAAASTKRPHEAGEPVDIYAPSRSLIHPPWLSERAEQQRAKVASTDVFHDFRFADRLPDSGIDFVNRVVEDAGKYYTAAHYDHGNGVAIADVDSDGLHDLYFTTQIGSNALYRNLGSGKFENVTERAGVGLADRISVTASFADVDNDGDADLFVTTVRGGNVLYRNNGAGEFEDVTAEAGLEYVGHSSSAVFFDYDRDGWLDLFLTNVGKYTTEEIGEGGFYRSREDAFAGHLLPELTERSILYRNLDGKQFVDVTEQTQLLDDSWSGDASPIDANGDGWIDLYVLDMQGHDEYFENIGGQRFENRRSEVFPRTPWGAMGIKVFDYDNDGQQDVFITDMHSDMSEEVWIDKEKLKSNMQWAESMLRSNGQSIYGNAFFRKRGDQYHEISDLIGSENYWPWGISVGDLNADGFDDVFIASSMNLPFRYGINSVLLNDAGRRFIDSEFVLGVEPRRDGRTAQPWYTLDCNGPDKDHMYAKRLNMTSGTAVVWGALGTRSSVLFDFDRDGDLDIVTNDFHSEPMVLESNLADSQEIHYLQVRLVGTKSNRDGLGAVVEVISADGTKHTKVHDGQSGYLSQSSQDLYFGLGSQDEVKEINVTWPSGATQTVVPENVNQRLTVTEPR